MTLRPEPYLSLDNRAIHDGLAALGRDAADRGVSMGTLAMAWTLAHPRVDAIITGPRRPQHIDEAIAAVELELSEDDAAMIGTYLSEKA